jgi:carbonic anhydrase
LLGWLRAFQDPREAVKTEVTRVKGFPFVPRSIAVHGLVYDLATGQVEVVVNGYDTGTG